MRVLLALTLLSFLIPDATAQNAGEALLAKLDCPDRVKDVAFSPDGKLLAAGYGWNVKAGVRVWRAADRSVVATLAVGNEDGANIKSVAFSPDGKLLAAANWNGDVFLWQVGNWSRRKTILANRGMAESLSFSPDNAKLALASETEAIIYNLTSGKATVLARRKDLISISFSPDSKSVFIFGDNALQIWDLESERLINTVRPAVSGFFGQMSRDGKYAIAGGGAVYGKKIVEIWETENQKKIGELSEFRSGLFALAISHSARLFALGGGDYGSGGDLSLWSLTDNREIGFVSFGRFPIDSLAFSPDDSILAAGSDDGFVLLYAVDRIHGPQVKKQDHALCGEILNEGDKAFIVPLSKVPGSMREEFAYAWKLEIVNPDRVARLSGSPVELSDWNIESRADDDRARINQLRPLRTTNLPTGRLDHIVFGDIQNPGWNEGSLAKIYSNGIFVVTNNPGRCLAYGRLDQLGTDFETVKARLVRQGLLTIPKQPLTIGAAHFRTRFIELALDGTPELRSDAGSIEVLLKGAPAKKRDAFTSLYLQEEPFINSLLKAGMKLPAN